MNKFLSIVFGALILVSTPALAGSSLNKLIDQTNFVVNSGCSGTLIDVKNKYVLTAAHCVGAQVAVVEKETFDPDGTVKKKKVRKFSEGTVSQITFQGSESISTTTYRTTLEKVDKDADLALLKIKADIPNTMAAKLACTDPQRGEHVFVVGNPMGILYSSVVDGLISSTQRDYELLGIAGTQEKQPLLQVSGGIIGGNSGGSVYNDDRALVGVPVLGHRVNETIGFAVPVSEVRKFLGDKVEQCQ